MVVEIGKDIQQWLETQRGNGGDVVFSGEL
jgi:hypothetical protein